MDDKDFGFYGKGLDGYVHYQQGMEEAEHSAPQSDSFEDSYDDADDDSAFEPVPYAPVSSAKPVTPPKAAEPQPAQTPALADGVRKPKWREHGWDIGLAASALLFLFFTMVSDTCQTAAADYAAAAAAGVFLAFVTVEIIRLALWIMRHM